MCIFMEYFTAGEFYHHAMLNGKSHISDTKLCIYITAYGGHGSMRAHTHTQMPACTHLIGMKIFKHTQDIRNP